MKDVDIVLWRAAWADGALDGVRFMGDGFAFDTPTGTSGDHETATWTGPLIDVGFAATELIPSWTAATPGGCFVRIELRGATTKWYHAGDWSAEGIRTSVMGQGDADASVDVDTLIAAQGRTLRSWQARVTLLRPKGSLATPDVRGLCVMASALPDPGEVTPSEPGAARGIVLDVPRLSQRIYPGGEGWCSPTSTAMVLGFWGLGAAAPDQAARDTFDQAYNGCGNWPFNIAYAGRFGARGFVTRLRSLREAEQFIASGIPLIASASYKKDQVPGLDYDTDGHLMVIVGVTTTGDLVLNDPNAADDASVRKTVGRAEWESAWLNTSRGVVYVIHPPSVALPPPPAQANW